MDRVAVNPDLLLWACERAGSSVEDLATRLPKLPLWIQGEKQPTLKQLENFAKATRAPLGYLFLEKPPAEKLPIPDFRTVANRLLDRPSPDLMDTLHICQQRQEWYREFALSMDFKPLDFVGSITTRNSEKAAASSIRESLCFNLEERRKMPTWTDALRKFIEQADEAGILVMVSGVVGSNNTRKLDPEEFRGFTLTDPIAPLVFINGSDTKAAQMFTLAHELVHVWLGKSALSDSQALKTPEHRIEAWCNRVAAEILVPLDLLRGEFDRKATLGDEVERLARRFKVSSLVILRRMHDAGHLDPDRYWMEYRNLAARLLALPRGSGGNFYLTLGARVSKRFARALTASALEGHCSFTDAFRLLGFKRMATFNELGHQLGVLV